MSYIQTKIISNKGDNSNSEFIVFSDDGFKNSDWLSVNKFEQINEKGLSTEALSYILKDYKKSNIDEGVAGQDGKALSVVVNELNVILKIYLTNSNGEWLKAREYVIEKKIYDAYSLCIKNDKEVLELDKKAKAEKKFDLKLA